MTTPSSSATTSPATTYAGTTAPFEPPPPQVRTPRSTLLELTRVIDIAASQDEVFDYVSDFRRAHEWRTEVLESTMEPPGRMRTGSSLREVAVVAGRRVITDSMVDTFEPSHRFTFEHVSGPLPVSGEYAVTPRLADPGRAATLRYTLRVRLVGGWRLLAPLINLTAPATIRRSLRCLASRVEACAATSSEGPDRAT